MYREKYLTEEKVLEDFFDFSRLSFDDSRLRVKPSVPTNDTPSMQNCIDNMPLAMAYVPMQRFRALYEPEAGFEKGTIFAELDMPFVGCKKNKRVF